jgi:hypothetical protein
MWVLSVQDLDSTALVRHNLKRKTELEAPCWDRPQRRKSVYYIFASCLITCLNCGRLLQFIAIKSLRSSDAPCGKMTILATRKVVARCISLISLMVFCATPSVAGLLRANAPHFPLNDLPASASQDVLNSINYADARPDIIGLPLTVSSYLSQSHCIMSFAYLKAVHLSR